jgi:outer membrane protein insertion porin family
MTRKRLVAVWPVLLFIWMFPASSFAGTHQGQVQVEQVLIQGNRRFPRETILYYIQTREGDIYNPAQLERDLKSLWAQNLFTDIQVLMQDGEAGGKIVIFRVKENPIIRDLQFKGLKSVTESDVLTRFREKRVGVSKEEMWDPAKGQVAKRVLKDLLGEKGHPEAEVSVESEPLSEAAVAVTFQIDEGPRVRVLEIQFEGNKIFSDDELRKPMKNVKQAGLITRFSSRDIYHPEALKDDLERMRFLVLADHGYLEAQIGEPRVESITRDKGFLIFPFRIPLISPPTEGLRIVIPVSEGRQFRFGKIEIEGNKVFSGDQVKAIIGIKPGDVVRSTIIQKGVYESLRDLYGRLGYIQMITHPDQDLKDDPSDPTKGIADFTISIEEGRQYALHYLEFMGNTNTRDKVLRREMLVSEGEVFDQSLWKYSLQRINQLGFFDEVKEQDATFKPNDRTGQLDIDLRVKEKGRNQIQFTGGASGIGGSFFGLEYSTNNLFGYGESLSFNVAAGNRQKYFLFSFTEPYLMDRNVSLGFSVFARSLDFFGGGLGAIGAGGLFGFDLRSDSLFKEKSTGFSVFTSTPMTTLTKRWLSIGRWTRVGLNYSYNSTSVEDPPVNRDNNPDNDIPVTFRQPDIRTSTVVPSLFYNALQGPLLDPTGGQSFSLSAGVSGRFLGGDVNLLEPLLEYKRFQSLPWKFRDKPTVFGFRFLAGHLLPYGRRFESNSLSFVGGTPIFSRFFLGGEDTIRGYNVRSISPVVQVERRLTTTNVVAVSGETASDLLRSTDLLPVVGENDPPMNTPFLRADIIRSFTFNNKFTNLSLIPIGGDTELLFNMEYRIPIAGPISLAAFGDIGSTFNLRRYNNQKIISNPLTQIISPFLGFNTDQLTSVVFAPGGGVVVNPNGELATQEEIDFARLAQGTPSGLLPGGFSSVFIRGLGQTTDTIFLSQAEAGFKGIDNYRASVGLEFRVLMPVVNVPFRLIYAYNPNAKANPGPFQIFREDRSTFRFSIGRTF